MNTSKDIVTRLLHLGISSLPIFAISALVTATSAPKAIAGRIDPVEVPCWYFKGEKLQFRQTCVYDSASWTGGYSLRLRWEDRVTTSVGHGLIGRGEKPCGNDYVIDGKTCGTRFFRNPDTMKRIAREEDGWRWREKTGRNAITCIQAKGSKNSFCWVHPY